MGLVALLEDMLIHLSYVSAKLCEVFKKIITLTGSVEEYNDVYNKVNVKICKVMGLAEV